MDLGIVDDVVDRRANGDDVVVERIYYLLLIGANLCAVFNAL